MTKFKIRVFSKEQSKKVQEIIFKNDPIVGWGKDKVREPQHLDSEFLLYNDDWPCITYTDSRVHFYAKHVVQPEISYKEFIEKYG